MTKDEMYPKKKSCENCKHYNQDFPPPFCLNCKTGFNNDYLKRDYWEIKEIKENAGYERKLVEEFIK